MTTIDQKALLYSAKKIRTDRILEIKNTIFVYLSFKIVSLGIVFWYSITEFLEILPNEGFLETVIELNFLRTIPIEEVLFFVYLISLLVSMAMFYFTLLSVTVTIENHPERVSNFIRHIAIFIRNYAEFLDDDNIRVRANNILSETTPYRHIRRSIALFGFLSVFGYALQISSVNFFVISLGVFLEGLTIIVIQSYGIVRLSAVSKFVNASYKELSELSKYLGIRNISYREVTTPKGGVYHVYHLILLVAFLPIVFLEVTFFVFIVINFVRFILDISRYIHEEWIFEDQILNLVKTILEKY